MKVDILAIGVHPDDIELSCSGTLLRQIALGHTVGLLDLTRGELGTRGNAEIRAREAADAAAILGALFRENLDMADGFFGHTPENLRAIANVIRQCRPRIVLANALSDRHPDHGRAAKLVSDACFLAGLAKVETTGRDGFPQERWRPQAVYHYIQDEHRTPDFVVDITPYFNKKMETIFAFRSQFYNPGSGEPDTPISSREFIEFMQAKNRVFGRPAGFEFAEGFNIARTPGVNDLFDLL